MRNLTLVLAVLLGAARAYAQVPQQFTVQGVLRNGMGALQSAMVNVSVSFFDAATNGNRIAGPYGPTAVMAVDGLFTLTIADSVIISKLQGKAQVWLQVTVGNDTFDPQIVTPEIFALMCSTADSFSGNLDGDVVGTQGATKVVALQGKAVASAAPASGQVLRYDGTGSQWAPAPSLMPGGTANEVAYRGAIQCASGGCSFPNTSWIQSGVVNGAGNYTINFAPGIFSGNPTCVTGVNTPTVGFAMLSPPTASGMTVYTYAANGSQVDGINFSIICMGPK